MNQEELLLGEYHTSLQGAQKDIKELFARHGKESGISFTHDTELFYYDLQPDEILKRTIDQHHHAESLADNVREEMKSVVHEAHNLKSLTDARNNFAAFKNELESTFCYLEELIKKIVDKYEFGQDI